jgi:hypothetical protein
MYSKQWAFCIVCSLTVMTAIGCYSHYPSSVYGPSGFPGTYALPPASGYPQGGTYSLPQNVPLQGSGASLGPANSFGSQSPSANKSTNLWEPSRTGGNATAFDATTNGVAPGSNDPPVPNYSDPNGDDAASADPFGRDVDFGDTEDFDNEPSSSTDEPGSPFKPVDPDAFSPDEGAASFVPPKSPLTPVASIRHVADSAEVAVTTSVPYKYDRENFQWLRGVVDYDSEAGSWNIIYNIEPDQQDQFGGSIVLAGAAADQFETLQNDDVILVEGEVDTERLDAFGKPMFRVARLDRLEPVN